MKELPILFSTPMVQANQAGTKNQTRRTQGLEKVNKNPSAWKFIYSNRNVIIGIFGNEQTGEVFIPKPRYNVGDKMWVKETFSTHDKNEEIPAGIVIYKADVAYPENYKWKSSLFMRKEYARMWLECIDVRVQRLSAISNYDAINEGIETFEITTDVAGVIYGTIKMYKNYLGKSKYNSDKTTSPIKSYMSLWKHINGKDSTELNPWVFIYDYKLIEKP